jgi:hypothetical protein
LSGFRFSGSALAIFFSLASNAGSSSSQPSLRAAALNLADWDGSFADLGRCVMLYRLYVDEVGNDDVPSARDERHRYLSLTGVAMAQDHARDSLAPSMSRLKAEIFRHDPDEAVILHRKDIMNRKRIFECLNDDQLCARFDDGLCEMISESQFRVITVLIDKLEMARQYHWQQKHPYHYLMEILVEKYAQWLERKESYGDIMPEKRRGPKDPALQRLLKP